MKGESRGTPVEDVRQQKHECWAGIKLGMLVMNSALGFPMTKRQTLTG
jgi:hypothetical protein